MGLGGAPCPGRGRVCTPPPKKNGFGVQVKIGEGSPLPEVGPPHGLGEGACGPGHVFRRGSLCSP